MVRCPTPATPPDESHAVVVGLDTPILARRAAWLGLQHLLSMIVGTLTPPLLLGHALGWSADDIALLVNAALLVSGVTSFLQIRRPGGFIGSGLLSVQGTSFAFFGLLLEAGHRGGAPLMFGMSMTAAPMGLLLGPLLPSLKRFFPPFVAGVIVMLIGLSLIPAAMNGISAGFGAHVPSWQGLVVAGATILLIVVFGSMRTPMIRTGTVIIAMAVGTLLSVATGHVPEFSATKFFAWPQPFHFGLAFQWELLLPFLFVYFVSALETVGDVTATAHLSGLPIEGEGFFRRLRGAVMADGINSLLAGCLNAFPNTTYAQNNGVIQLTGVASRRVGYFMCGFLVLCGFMPVIGQVAVALPAPVFGGAMLLLFAHVATSGMRIIHQSYLGNREWMIVAAALGIGLGVSASPHLLDPFPTLFRTVFASSVVSGGVTALLLNACLQSRSGINSNR